MKIKPFLFASIFVLASLATIPIASATSLSWSTLIAAGETFTDAADIDYGFGAFDSTHFAFTYKKIVSAQNDLYATSCTTGPVCSETAIAQSGSNEGAGNDFKTLKGTSLGVGCYQEASNSDLYVYFTTNKGATWGQTNVDSTGTVGDGCGVALLSATTWMVVEKDGTNGAVKVFTTTNTGSSYSSVTTTVSNSGTRDFLGIAAVDVNHYTLLISDSGGVVRTCTTTTGVACITTTLSAETGRADGGKIIYVNGTYYLALAMTGSVNVRVCSSTAPPLFTCGDIPSSSTGNAPQISLAATTNSKLAVGWTLNTGTAVGKVAHSEDGGATWAIDTSYTHGSAITGQNIGTGADSISGVLYEFHGFAQPSGTSKWELATATQDVIASTAIGSSATASVTNLVGFNVDPTGGIAIARTELGENIQIFNAQGLGSPVGGPVDTNCATGSNPYEDAVMAKSIPTGNGATLVGFLNCDAGGDAQFFSIRQSNGDVPTAAQFADLTGETCTPGGGGTECPYNIDLSQFSDDSVDNGLGQLGQVEDFPIDYSNNQEDAFRLDHREVAWAFASQQCDDPPGPSYCNGSEPGMVGVAMFTAQTDPVESNDENADSVQEHPSQDATDFCLGKDGGSYYLAAVGPGQPGRSWGVTFAQTDAQSLDATISGAGSGFGISGGAISCGGGQILMLNGDSTIQYLTRTGVFVDSVAVTSQANRGIAISDEFVGSGGSVSTRGNTCLTALEGTGNCEQYGVYVAGTEGIIVNVTGGNIVEVGRITLPSGTFKSIDMDRTAQNIWVATSTTIARFLSQNVTTITPINRQSEDNPPPLATGGLFGPGSQANHAFSNLGVSDFGGGVLWAVGMIGGCTVGAGTIAGSSRRKELSWSWPFAIVGGVLGFFLAWGFGFLNTALVFGIIVLAALGLGFRFYKHRVSGGME